MIELAKHIEILLLDNDCVIVPDLGGFIAHYQPAHFEEEENLYMPPMRTIGFNPQLTMNDGMLTQSYMQTYHTDFADATRMIADQVEKLKEYLYKEGMITLCGIGDLYYTIRETYEFHPIPNGILSPSLYALDAFSIAPLGPEIIEEEPLLVEKPTNEILPEKKEYRIPQWWSHVAAVVVAFVLFFSFSIPVENTYIDNGNYASLGTDCLFDAIRSHSMATSLVVQEVETKQSRKSSSIVPVAVKVEKVLPANPSPAPVLVEKKEEPKPVVKQKEVREEVKLSKTQVAKQNKYHIIVASLTTQADAQRILQEYNAQGYKDASILSSKGRFRISLCSYGDKSAAYQKLGDLKNIDAFKNAWMLTSK